VSSEPRQALGQATRLLFEIGSESSEALRFFVELPALEVPKLAAEAPMPSPELTPSDLIETLVGPNPKEEVPKAPPVGAADAFPNTEKLILLAEGLAEETMGPIIGGNKTLPLEGSGGTDMCLKNCEPSSAEVGREETLAPPIEGSNSLSLEGAGAFVVGTADVVVPRTTEGDCVEPLARAAFVVSAEAGNKIRNAGSVGGKSMPSSPRTGCSS